MKRTLRLALLAALAISGCNRAPTGTATSPADPKNTAPASKPAAPADIPNVPISFTPEHRSLVPSEEVPLLEQIDRENTRVVNAILPCIVRITASHAVDPRMRLFGNGMPFQLPFGSGQRHYVQQNDIAYGSGVVISRNGYVLTNNHVVEEASSVEIQLDDKRTFKARVIASDDLVDVAILKVDATDLSAIPWGDSDKVQIGEQVFAIGNPFDLDDSVSKGIVSAKGRNLPQSHSYQDYIQTDAAINPGNSGGALVNIHGELIGLNAAIASTTRFNMGIGFAIPSNLVRYAVESLLKEGHLVRGYLGVILPDSVGDGVISHLNLKSSEGAFLAGITPNSPADKAKLHAFDFITSVDGHKVDSESGLRLIVAQIPIGKTVDVNYVRDGKSQTTQVQIQALPDDQNEFSSTTEPNGDEPVPDTIKPPAGTNVLTGVQVVDLNDKARQKFSIENSVTSGVIVNGVQEGSTAENQGIQRGDVIVSAAVNRGATQQLASSKDFANLSGQLKSDEGVVLLVHDPERGSSFVYLAPSEE
jgi:serine protease Do